MPAAHPRWTETPLAYVLVPPIWLLSLFAALNERDGIPHAATLTLQGLGFIALGVVTFRWGRSRGYALRNPSGDVSAENIVRCLAMTLLMSVPVGLATSGLAAIIFRTVK